MNETSLEGTPKTVFSARNIERLTGALLVASILAFVIHGVVFLIQGAVDGAVFFFIFLNGVLLFLSAVALYLTFRPYEPTLSLFGALGFAAHGLSAILLCALFMAQVKFAQEFGSTGGEETETVKTVFKAFDLTMFKVQTTAFIFLNLGLAPLGVLIVWSGAVARWLGWLGVVGGSLGFVILSAGLFDFIEGDAATITTFSSIMAAFVFILILGVRLIVREMRRPTEE